MPTLIDIGSMNGEELMWGIDHGYEVHAFEPNPSKKSILEPAKKVATINYAAAWNEDGVSKLFKMENSEPGEDGLSLIEQKSNVGPYFIEVPTINIGKYLYELNEDIDILKINAEGAEYIIIESILNEFDPKHIKHWLVEDHKDWIPDEEWKNKRKEVLSRLKKLKIKIKNWKQGDLNKYV